MKLPYRILVLDDDEHALSGIVELLRDAGHQVTGTPTYDAAKQLLGASPFDLLVSDVRVRSFNGLHLVMQSRKDHPEMAIVIITGYDDPLIDPSKGRMRDYRTNEAFREKMKGYTELWQTGHREILQVS